MLHQVPQKSLQEGALQHWCALTGQDVPGLGALCASQATGSLLSLPLMFCCFLLVPADAQLILSSHRST